MSALRRSPAIPLSPSSPPESGLKQRHKRRHSEDISASPTTPPFMSVATKSYGSSYGNAQSSAEHSSHLSPSPTASSTYTQQSTQPVTYATSTPASSIPGISRVATMEDLDQHRDKRQRMDIDAQDQNQEFESTMQPTNHDRQPAGTAEDPAPAPAPVDRDEHDEEVGDAHEVSGSHRMPEDASLEKLQEDTGEAFLLCKSTIPRSRPDPKDHLLSKFGLIPLLQTVARIDPRNGDKINPLRKSYENQIKNFGLAGRNKSVKADAVDDWGRRPLRTMVELPQDKWSQEHEQTPIEATSDFKAQLQKAMRLRPGTVRNNMHWESVLGHEKARAVVLPQPLPLKGVPMTAAPARLANGIVRPRSAAAANRPRRSNKKRSYQDDSFEGYGDGFDDDLEIDDGALSDEEEGGGSARKKRKKDHPFGASPTTYEGDYARSR